MNCDQVREIIGLYLDSELDGRSATEVRAHLEECQECAALYHRERAFDEALRARLKPSAPTVSLWKAEEAFVAETLQRPIEGETAPRPRRGAAARRNSFWREFLWPAPSYYAGLAVVWLLLLALRPGPPEPARPAMAHPRMSPEARFALLEQRRELKELLASPDPAPKEQREKPAPPRSERPEPEREA